MEKTKASRRYVIRFSVSMAVYVVLLSAGVALANLAGESAWRFAAMALPIPAILAVIWAVARYATEADEMQSGDLTKSLAIAFGAGSAITFRYGIMQVVGAPALNWMFVWPVFAVCWLLSAWRIRRTRS